MALNLVDYGYVEGTSSAKVLNDAINAAAVAKTELNMPEGKVVLVDGVIALRNGMTKINGNNCTVRFTKNGYFTNVENIGLDGLAIENLNVDYADDAAITSAGGFVLLNPTRCSFSNCHVKANNQHGILFRLSDKLVRNNEDSFVDRCTTEVVWKTDARLGIAFDYSGGGQTDKYYVQNQDIPTPTAYHVGVRVSNCRSIGSRYGIVVYRTKNAKIYGNYTERNVRSIVQQEACDNNHIYNNECTEFESSSILINYKTTNSLIEGNTLRSTVAAIQAFFQFTIGSNNNVVRNNKCYAPSGRGPRWFICLAADCYANTIENNVFEGNCQKTPILIETDFLYDASHTSWSYAESANTETHKWATRNISDVKIINNTFSTTSDVPLMVLHPVGDLNIDNLTFKDNVLQGNSATKPYVLVVKTNGGDVTNPVFQNNQVPSLDPAKFILDGVNVLAGFVLERIFKMVCKSNKLDSNSTELRYSEEECPRQLPTNPVWHKTEPNSYSDFGGQLTTQAREPISGSRQRKKGVVTDLEASGGFNQDLTLTNTFHLLQGFMFADVRERKTTRPLNGTATVLTGVAGAAKTISATSGLDGFAVGSLVKLSGFGVTANKGLFTVASAAAGSLVLKETLTDEASPPATATVETVGFEFADGKVNAVLNGKLLRLTTGDVNPAVLKLIAGEWVFIGGDAATANFTNNTGFARVSYVGTDYIEFDKCSFTPKAEVGTGKAIQLFFAKLLKNESDPNLIKRRTYQLERYLGQDKDGAMSEYLIGAVANELTLNVSQADKVNVDLSFIAMDNEQRDGTKGLKAGERPDLKPEDAFNTSSDISRIKLAMVTDDASPEALFAFATELTLTINNNVSATKAIGVLGAMDTSAGIFEVGGNMTVYFADVKAAQAVRNNADVTIDVIMQKRNSALMWDIPLMSLGDGRLNVEKDQAITLPLETQAVESKFGHTLMFEQFNYLPDIAGGV